MEEADGGAANAISMDDMMMHGPMPNPLMSMGGQDGMRVITDASDLTDEELAYILFQSMNGGGINMGGFQGF